MVQFARTRFAGRRALVTRIDTILKEGEQPW
jgi:hypothetical protein